MSERPILLAEDNPKDLELTLEALTDSNLINRIVAVRDGVEAMEYLLREGKYNTLKYHIPSVVILDIKMPRMDGIEVLRAIRQSDSFLKLTPVVMLTSSREEKDLILCYELGANAYIVKPVLFSNFIEAVKTLGVFWANLNERPSDMGTSK
jgi:CheY-like chemotaxis protein